MPSQLTQQCRQRKAVVQLASRQHRLPLLGIGIMQRGSAVGQQARPEGAVGALRQHVWVGVGQGAG